MLYVQVQRYQNNVCLGMIGMGVQGGPIGAIYIHTFLYIIHMNQNVVYIRCICKSIYLYTLHT
jgi:hypothetical protein